MNKDFVNLNDYTLINKNANQIVIYFYPAHSITKTKVKKLEKEVCIRFIIDRRNDGLCDMHASLITDIDKEQYNSYNMLSKEIDNNKFAFVYDADDSLDAEVLPKGVIDFNVLDYDYFISVLKNNDDLLKLVPYLSETLRDNIKTLQNVQDTIEHLDVMGPSTFFQNTIAYYIDRIEELMDKDEDQEFREQILSNIKKNFLSVFRKKQVEINLSYINLIAIIIKNIQSQFIKPISYLEAKELKCDTNKDSIGMGELTDILDNILNDYEHENEKEVSYINERVKSFLYSKPYIKEFKNYLRIIFADSRYLLANSKDRIVLEECLKNVIIDCFADFTYRSLQRNQVLLYHISEDRCDFMCIVSTDFIFSLLQTYRLNSQIENQGYINDYKVLLNLYRGNDQNSKEDLIRIYILLILMLNIYYYKNMGSLTLFNKGKFILKLDFKKGDYDIQAINRDTEESIGHLIKISTEMKEKIKLSLSKNEKAFNELINGILLDNLEENISLGTIMTDVNTITHKDIVIYLSKNRKNDIFDLTVTLDEFLLLLTEFKPASDIKKEKKAKSKKNNDLEKTQKIKIIENDRDKDKAFVLRKADTIYNIMEINEIDSDDYRTIASLYGRYLKEDELSKKEEIIKQLKDIILR